MPNIARCFLCALSIPLLLGACSTASKVPEIKSDALPAARFKALSPRTIQISAKNDREINQRAGNAAEIEKVVRDAVADAVTRGGLKVQDTAPSSLALTIEDYSGDANLPGASEGTCIKISVVLKAKWGSSIAAGENACHYLQRESGVTMGGDLSEAYTLALKHLLVELEKHQMDLLRGSGG